MDPLNLILLIIVVAIGLRLRSVLGTRNDDDNSDARADAYRLNRDAFDGQSKEPLKAQPEPVIQPVEPESQTAPVAALSDADEAAAHEALQEAEPAIIEGRGLAYLRDVQPGFDEADFLQGAGRAYEMILTAFAADDLSPVAAFLGADVAAGFEAAIAARQDEGKNLVTRILRLDRPALDDARIEAGLVQLDVRFRAEIISFTQDTNVDLDEDNLPPPVTMHDVWVFERPLESTNPAWQLVATHSAA